MDFRAYLDNLKRMTSLGLPIASFVSNGIPPAKPKKSSKANKGSKSGKVKLADRPAKVKKVKPAKKVKPEKIKPVKKAEPVKKAKKIKPVKQSKKAKPAKATKPPKYQERELLPRVTPDLELEDAIQILRQMSEDNQMTSLVVYQTNDPRDANIAECATILVRRHRMDHAKPWPKPEGHPHANLLLVLNDVPDNLWPEYKEDIRDDMVSSTGKTDLFNLGPDYSPSELTDNLREMYYDMTDKIRIEDYSRPTKKIRAPSISIESIESSSSE